jgi:hypothetical protein
MLARLTNLETKQVELDGKVSDVLDKMHANNQVLVNIKSMFSNFLGKLKDQGNVSSIELKVFCEQLPSPPSPHVVVIVRTLAMLFESDPLDTFGVSRSNGSVHFLSRGKTRASCIDACGSSKMLVTATPPSKKVVSDPNFID